MRALAAGKGQTDPWSALLTPNLASCFNLNDLTEISFTAIH